MGHLHTCDHNNLEGMTLIPSPNTGRHCFDHGRETKGFELVGTGNYTADDTLRTVTALGLRTARGLKVPRQTWHKILRNPLDKGWVKSGDLQVRGNFTSPARSNVRFLDDDCFLHGRELRQSTLWNFCRRRNSR